MTYKNLLKKFSKLLKGIKKLSPLILFNFLPFAGFLIYSELTNPAPTFHSAPENSNYLYEAENEVFKVGIGDKKTGSAKINFENKKGDGISFNFLAKEDVSVNLQDKGRRRLVFNDVDKGIDLEYETLGNGLKEWIVVDQSVNRNFFLFETEMEGLKAVNNYRDVSAPGFINENGDYAFNIQKGYAIDAAGKRTENVYTRFIQKDSKNYIKVDVDPKWFESKDRRFPVRIDPTIVYDESSEFANGTFNRNADTGSGSSPNVKNTNIEQVSDGSTVALWHMDEASGTRDDAVGGNNLSDNNTVTSAAGKVGNAASFESSNSEYLSLSDNADISVGNMDFSISAWIKPDSIGGNNMIITKYTNASVRDYQFYINTSSYIQLEIFNSSGTQVGTVQASTFGTLTSGQWYFVYAFHEASSSRIGVAVNGIFDYAAATGDPADTAANMQVGARAGTLFWDGLIDELAFRKRLLTAEEIQLAQSNRPYSVYTSDVIDFGNDVTEWGDFIWDEIGITTEDGETIFEDTDLVAQWNLNGTSGTTATNDAGSCGATCNGTLTNFASTSGQDAATTGWTADNRRWGSGALTLDGSNDIVSIGNVSALNFERTDDFTIETWARRNTFGGNDTIFTKMEMVGGGFSVNRGYQLDIRGDMNSVLNFMIRNSDSGSNRINVKGTNPILDTKWHHIVATYDGSSVATGMKLYVDGTQDPTITVTDNLSATIQNVGVAGIAGNGNYGSSFDGTLDSLRIYSRALNPEEILSNYNSSNINFQTRVGADGSPDDGDWEDWKPATSEDQIDNFDSNNPSDGVFNMDISDATINQNWQKVSNSIPSASDTSSTLGRLPLGTNGTGDDAHIYGISVIKDGSTYKMWYGGHDGTNIRIYYATSPDGLVWTKYDNSIPSNSDTTSTNGRIPLGTNGTGDDAQLGYPTVIKDGNTYKMWYSGNDGSSFRIYYATSPDGLVWTKYDNSIPSNSDTTSTNGRIPLGTNGTGDDNRTFTPAVIKEDTTYKMWYAGDDGSNNRIYYATSSNGLTWTKFNNATAPNCNSGYASCGGYGRIGLGTSGLADDGAAYTPNVIKDGNTYKMWYTGYDGVSAYVVLLAVSYDGITWKKQSNATPSTSDYSGTLGRIPLGSNTTGDDSQVFASSTIKETDGTYKTWYGGYDGSNYRIFAATMSSLPYSQSTDSVIKIEGDAAEKFQVGETQVDSSTVALWHLDETNGDNVGVDVFDATSNNNDGEFNGSNIATSVIDGISGKARNFNGTDDYISLPNDTFSSVASGTISAWIKPTGTGTQGMILYIDDNNATDGQAIFELENNKIHWAFETSGGAWSPDAYGATNMTYNQWHHVAVTVDSSGWKIYLDGKLDSSGSETNFISGVGAPQLTQIGSGTGGSYASRNLKGSLDELLISKRVLTAEEIAEQYRIGRDHYINKTIPTTDLSDKNSIPFWIAADRPGTYLEATVGESAYANYQPDLNTVGLWHMAEVSGSGAYIKDSSGTANDGTPTGTTSTQGKIGMSRAFDGVDDYISIPNSTSLQPSNITIGAWIKVDSNITPETYGVIIDKAYSSHSNPYYDYHMRLDNLSNTNPDLNACFVIGSLGAEDCNTVSAVITKNIWQYVVTTFDGTTMKLYLNGRMIASKANSGSINYSNQPLFIGAFKNLTNGNFPGLIEEVSISNIARSASEIRQAYEIGLRSHSITIDFTAALDASDTIADSDDNEFTIDATPYGLSQKGSMLFKGDKVIVREKVNDTEYIAQAAVTSVDQATGEITVSDWDSGSTFPSSGYTGNATVFKWQREFWPIQNNTLPEHMDDIIQLTLRITNGDEGRTVWIDDLKSAGDYLTDPTGSEIDSSLGNRYFQYRSILTSTDPKVSASFTGVEFSYIAQTPPNTPTLDSPADRTKTSLSPQLKTTADDGELDNLQYKIILCENASMNYNCQTFDQTSSQTGWSGQNAETSTMYSSGTQATYTIQTPLVAGKVYYWKSYAIDPNGLNQWSSTQTTARVIYMNSHPRSPSVDNYEHYIARRENPQNATSSGWNAITGSAQSGTTASTNGWIDSANLTAGDRYLVMVWGEHNSDSTSATSGLRVKHGSTSFSESESVEKTGNTNTSHKTPYNWFTVWEAESGEDLEVELYWGGQAGSQARVEDVTLVAINAEELIANGDLKYDIDTTGGAIGTSFDSEAQLTWTPANNNDAWWILGYTQPEITAVNQGVLDTSWASSGMISYNSGGSQSDSLWAIISDTDGNIYAAGSQGTNGGDWVIRKYDSTGTLDTSWGSSGTVTYNSGASQNDTPYTINLDSNNNIYVGGYIGTNGIDFAVRKYDSAGTLDTSWGSSGMVTYNSGATQNDLAQGIAVDSSASIYVTGRQQTNGYDMIVRKYDSTGTLDTGWGSSGMVTYNSGSSNADSGIDITIDSDENIYVVGTQQTNNYDIFVRKYDASGTLDTSWGSSGTVTYNHSGSENEGGQTIELDDDRNIYVGGEGTEGTGDWDWIIRKYNSSGILDTGWGSSGMVTYGDSNGDQDRINAIALDSSRSVYATGWIEISPGDYDWGIRKYDSTGTLDTDWGSSGMITYDAGDAQSQTPNAIEVYQDTNLFVAGVQDTNGGDWAIRKYISEEPSTFKSRLNINSTPYNSQEIPQIYHSEDDTPVYSLGTVSTLPNSSNTLSLQMSQTESSIDWNASAIMALNLNSFQNLFFASKTGNNPNMTTAAEWVEQLNGDPLIQLQNRWLIAAGGLVNDNGARVISRIQDSDINITDDTGGWLKGAGNLLSTNLGDLHTSWTAGLKNIDFDSQTTVSGTANLADPWLVGFTLEKYKQAIGPRPDSPSNGATNQALKPQLKTTAIDADNENMKYKIQMCTNLAMTTGCQTFDQTASQSGWSGQNANGNTRYQSGSQATYTISSDLAANTTYYWRAYAIDETGLNVFSPAGEIFSFTTTATPTSPTSLETEGETNPSMVIDSTPEFTAIHNDPNSDSANAWKIQVNTAADFTGTVMWNPNKTSMTTTANGARSPEVSYAGNTLQTGVTYYWRIKFWDTNGAEGAYSAAGSFTMAGLNPVTGCYLEEADDFSSITVHWTDTNSIEQNYRVQRSVNGGAFSTLITKAADSTSHEDTTTSLGNSYRYRIAGILGSEVGAYCTTTTAQKSTGSIIFDGIIFQ